MDIFLGCGLIGVAITLLMPVTEDSQEFIGKHGYAAYFVLTWFHYFFIILLLKIGFDYLGW